MTSISLCNLIVFEDPHKYSSNPDPQLSRDTKKQQNVLTLSNEFDEIIEMDRDQDSVKLSNKALESVDKVKEKHPKYPVNHLET